MKPAAIILTAGALVYVATRVCGWAYVNVLCRQIQGCAK